MSGGRTREQSRGMGRIRERRGQEGRVKEGKQKVEEIGLEESGGDGKA